MPKFRHSLDNQATWTTVNAGAAQVIPSAPGQTAFLEAIGDAVTSQAPLFLNDTFTTATAKAITAHVGESGNSWLHNPATPVANVLQVGTGGSIYGATALVGIANSQVVPASASYFVEAEFIIRSVLSSISATIGGRSSNADAAYYGMFYEDGFVRLVRADAAGARTILASVAYTPALGTPFTMRVVMAGNQISGWLNGTQVIAPITDNTITRVGTVMVRIFGQSSSPTTGPHISNVTAGLI